MGTMKRHWGGLMVLALLAACSTRLPAMAHMQESPAAAPERAPKPQEPRKPLPYTEEEVTYENPDATGVQLAATFTRPKGDAAAPAILLLSGAGPQDRDETIAGHKPFLILADNLTRRGFAVLRADDRGTRQSTGDYQNATTQDFASDARAGLIYLASRKDVDVKRIGLLGHGEGAIAAAMVAASDPQRVAFVVLLDGTAYPGQKVLLEQTSRAEQASGLSDEQVEADFRLGSGLYKMVEDGRSAADMQKALATVPENYKVFAEPWKRQVPKLQSRWLRFFLTYDPSAALEKIKCPVLAVFGSKDMTLDPEENASAMKSAFSHGHNHNVKIKVLPNLNYLLQKANTGLGREYSSIQETMSPVALETIGDWLSKEAAFPKE